VEDPVEVVDLMGDQAGGAAELARLAKALGGVEGYGPMVYLGAVDGLRWGEMAGLRVGRVDTEDCTAAVVETIVRGRKGSVGGLVAAGVDVKTAQSVLAHTDARVTLDLYAQAVTEQQQAAADAMAARFDVGTTRPKTTERARDQALSRQSGGGDLNSRPLRPEAWPVESGRPRADGCAGQIDGANGGGPRAPVGVAGQTRG
jgi:hypothetical protein